MNDGHVSNWLLLFIAVASSLALIASLEPILGRPFPQFHFSRPVRRSRLFLIVPLSMGAVFWLVEITMLQTSGCNDCSTPLIWQRIEETALALGCSAAVGWTLYFTLSILHAVWSQIATFRRRSPRVSDSSSASVRSMEERAHWCSVHGCYAPMARREIDPSQMHRCLAILTSGFEFAPAAWRGSTRGVGEAASLANSTPTNCRDSCSGRTRLTSAADKTVNPTGGNGLAFAIASRSSMPSSDP